MNTWQHFLVVLALLAPAVGIAAWTLATYGGTQ